jgi:hypothetical protein
MPTYFIISGKGSRATRYTKVVDKILTHQNIDLEKDAMAAFKAQWLC